VPSWWWLLQPPRRCLSHRRCRPVAIRVPPSPHPNKWPLMTVPVTADHSPMGPSASPSQRHTPSDLFSPSLVPLKLLTFFLISIPTAEASVLSTVQKSCFN